MINSIICSFQKREDQYSLITPDDTINHISDVMDNQDELDTQPSKVTAREIKTVESQEDKEKIAYTEKLIDIFEEIGVTKGKHKELAQQMADIVFKSNREWGVYRFKDVIGRNQENRISIVVRYQIVENDTLRISDWYLGCPPEGLTHTHGFVLEDHTGLIYPKVILL